MPAEAPLSASVGNVDWVGFDDEAGAEELEEPEVKAQSKSKKKKTNKDKPKKPAAAPNQPANAFTGLVDEPLDGEADGTTPPAPVP